MNTPAPLVAIPPHLYLHIHIKSVSSSKPIHSFYHHTYFKLPVITISRMILNLNDPKISVPVPQQKLFLRGTQLEMGDDLVTLMFPEATPVWQTMPIPSLHPPLANYIEDVTIFCAPKKQSKTWMRYMSQKCAVQRTLTALHALALELLIRISIRDYYDTLPKNAWFYFKFGQSECTNRGILFKLFVQFFDADIAPTSVIFAHQNGVAGKRPQNKTPAVPFTIVANPLDGTIRFESSEDCFFGWCNTMNMMIEAREYTERLATGRDDYCYDPSLVPLPQSQVTIEMYVEMDPSTPFLVPFPRILNEMGKKLMEALKKDGLRDRVDPLRHYASNGGDSRDSSCDESLDSPNDVLSDDEQGYASDGSHDAMEEGSPLPPMSATLDNGGMMVFDNGEVLAEFAGLGGGIGGGVVGGAAPAVAHAPAPAPAAAVPPPPPTAQTTTTIPAPTPAQTQQNTKSTTTTRATRKRVRSDAPALRPNKRQTKTTSTNPPAPLRRATKLSDDELGWCFSFIPNNYDIFLGVALTCKHFYQIVHQHHTTWQERFFEVHINNISENYSHLCSVIDQVSPHLYHLRCIEPWYDKLYMPPARNWMDPFLPRYRNVSSSVFAMGGGQTMSTSQFRIEPHPVYKHLTSGEATRPKLRSLEFCGDYCRLSLASLIALLRTMPSLEHLRVESFVTDAVVCPRTKRTQLRDPMYDYQAMSTLKRDSLKLRSVHLCLSPLCVFSQPQRFVRFVEHLLDACGSHLRQFSLYIHEKHPQRNVFDFRPVVFTKLRNCESVRLENVQFRANDVLLGRVREDVCEDAKEMDTCEGSTTEGTATQTNTTASNLAYFPCATTVSLLDASLREDVALRIVEQLPSHLECLELRVQQLSCTPDITLTMPEFSALQELRLVNFVTAPRLLALCPSTLKHLHVENEHIPLDLGMAKAEDDNNTPPDTEEYSDYMSMHLATQFQCRFTSLESLGVVGKQLSPVGTSLELLFMKNALTMQRVRIALTHIPYNALLFALKCLHRLTTLSLKCAKMEVYIPDVLQTHLPATTSSFEFVADDEDEEWTAPVTPLPTGTTVRRAANASTKYGSGSGNASASTMSSHLSGGIAPNTAVPITNPPIYEPPSDVSVATIDPYRSIYPVTSLKLTSNNYLKGMHIAAPLLCWSGEITHLHIGGNSHGATVWFYLLDMRYHRYLHHLTMSKDVLTQRGEGKFVFAADRSFSYCPLWLNVRELREFYVTPGAASQSLPSWSITLMPSTHSSPSVDLCLFDYMVMCHVLSDVQVARGIYPRESDVIELAKLVSETAPMVTVDIVLSCAVYEMLRTFVGKQIPAWKCMGRVPYSTQQHLLSRVHDMCRSWHAQGNMFDYYEPHLVSDLQIFLENTERDLKASKRLPLLVARLRWELQRAVEALHGRE